MKQLKEEKDRRDLKIEIFEWIKSIVVAVIIAILLKTFVFNTTYVMGNSMHPTLHEADRLFANKLTLYFSGPERGEIIILKAPYEDKDYIKRVIALEGDTVDIVDGRVYLNGKELKEDYIEDGVYTHVYGKDHWEVEEGHIFVLGDNREEGASKDSRYFDLIPIESVKGITSFRYFPFNKCFGKL